MHITASQPQAVGWTHGGWNSPLWDGNPAGPFLSGESSGSQQRSFVWRRAFGAGLWSPLWLQVLEEREVSVLDLLPCSLQPQGAATGTRSCFVNPLSSKDQLAPTHLGEPKARGLKQSRWKANPVQPSTTAAPASLAQSHDTRIVALSPPACPTPLSHPSHLQHFTWLLGEATMRRK